MRIAKHCGLLTVEEVKARLTMAQIITWAAFFQLEDEAAARRSGHG